MSRYLNLLDVCAQGSRTLGPGLRYVIWTQGCTRRCPGCTTPEGQDLTPHMMCEVERVAADIVKRSEIEGVTISGGEPMLQAAALTELVRLVRASRPELTVLCYTGFVLEELTWPDAAAFVEQIDVLIDGPYIEAMNDGRGLRGSSNQRIHCLTNRLADWLEEMETGVRRSEIYVADQRLVEIGIPSRVI